MKLLPINLLSVSWWCENPISVAGGRRMRELFQWVQGEGKGVCGEACAAHNGSFSFFALKGPGLGLTAYHSFILWSTYSFKTHHRQSRKGIFNLIPLTKTNSKWFKKLKIKIQLREPLSGMYRQPFPISTLSGQAVCFLSRVTRQSELRPPVSFVLDQIVSITLLILYWPFFLMHFSVHCSIFFFSPRLLNVGFALTVLTFFF